jgi:hypothetical protein
MHYYLWNKFPQVSIKVQIKGGGLVTVWQRADHCMAEGWSLSGGGLVTVAVVH